MTTFKQFLLESESRVKGISVDQAIDLMRKHSRRFLATNSLIFRGGSGYDIRGAMLGDSNAGRARESANTINYYTLWMDNHPDWKNFPKRSRSFIASTDYGTAFGFGAAHVMVPFDNANIAVVPENDLWGAFDLGTFESLDDLVISIHIALHFGLAKLDTKGLLDPPPNIGTYEVLVDQLQALDDSRLKAAIELLQGDLANDVTKIGVSSHESKHGIDAMQSFRKELKDKGVQNVAQLFRKYLTTEKFHLTPAATFESDDFRDNELAIQGQAVFLPVRDPYDKEPLLSEEDLSKLQEFFREEGNGTIYKTLKDPYA